MTTTARRCAGCGGPLPQTEDGQRQVTCPFCGIVNELSAASAGPQPIRIDVDLGGVQRAASGVARRIAVAVVLVFGAAIAIAALSIYRAARPMADAARQATATVREMTKAIDDRRRPIEPSALGGPEIAGTGWRPLHTPAAAGGWTAFDPVANVAWANAIGRAWQADARLSRIDVARLTPDGVVDVSESVDGTVSYRFVSPSPVEACY